MGKCPNCSGLGCRVSNGRACDRCVGTGQVRFYSDGHIGNERTRTHPNDPIPFPQKDPGRELNEKSAFEPLKPIPDHSWTKEKAWVLDRSDDPGQRPTSTKGGGLA